MKRRKFLTVATSAAAVGGIPTQLSAEEVAVSPATPLPSLPTVEDMDAYVARVDLGMARIAARSAITIAGDAQGNREEFDALMRTATQSMFLTGMLGDLPLASQAHPGMQDRIANAIPIFDEAYDRMDEFLATRTEADLANVQRALRTPGVSQRVIDSFDVEAEMAGVSQPRREQTRQMMALVANRLASQPPALVIGEYREKVAKAADSDIYTEARRQELAARLGESVYWSAERSTRDKRMVRGLKVMGVGLITFGVGGLFVAGGAFAGVFLMTIGVIVMIVGLLILLVGALTPKPALKLPG